MRLLIASSLALALACGPAHADDGVGAIENGVITFSKSASVQMKSEVLKLSMDGVTADFTFFNTAATDQEILVAFPIPELDLASTDGYNIPVEDSDNFMGFTTEIDGKTIDHGLEQRAFLPDGKEVTADIRKLGLPMVRPYWDYVDLLNKLPEETQKAAIAAGVAAGEPGDISPNYIVRSNFFFKATFPAGKPVRIVQRYKPSYDVSNMSVMVGGQEPDSKTLATYCIKPDLPKAVAEQEAKLAAAGGDTYPYLLQFLLRYILATAKTWSGPIGSFHLIVETHSADQMLSTCLPLKQTGPTTWEMQAQNYVPDRDIDIMFVGGTYK